MSRGASVSIGASLTIPTSEFQWKFVRAPGPGGQNVNKLATAAELRWDILNSPSLPEPVRQRLMNIARTRISSTGILIIQAKRHRTQERNRDDALERLIQLVKSALTAPKPRKATKPTRGSKLRRLDGKRRQADKKNLRRNSYE